MLFFPRFRTVLLALSRLLVEGTNPMFRGSFFEKAECKAYRVKRIDSGHPRLKRAVVGTDFIVLQLCIYMPLSILE